MGFSRKPQLPIRCCRSISCCTHNASCFIICSGVCKELKAIRTSSMAVAYSALAIFLQLYAELVHALVRDVDEPFFDLKEQVYGPKRTTNSAMGVFLLWSDSSKLQERGVM
jgi:hypothetical protein